MHKVKAKEIESLLNKEGYSCRLIGNSEVEAKGFSDPSDYRKGTLIWLGDLKYLVLKEGQSYEDITLLLCSEDFQGKENFPNVLVSDDPRNAFIRLMELSSKDEEQVGVHPSAVISPDAQIGSNVFIGPNVVIGTDVVIGDGCKLMSGCYVEHTTLGNNCKIFPNCVIGTAAFGFRKNNGLVMEPHIGRVVLSDCVEILAGSVVERGTTKDTTIGRGTKLACLTNVGHNVTVGEDCQIIGAILNGFANIGDRCELIRCIVGNRIKIGEDTKVGLNSTVVRDLPDHVIAFGSPAHVRGEN